MNEEIKILDRKIELKCQYHTLLAEEAGRVHAEIMRMHEQIKEIKSKEAADGKE